VFVGFTINDDMISSPIYSIAGLYLEPLQNKKRKSVERRSLGSINVAGKYKSYEIQLIF